MPVLMTLIHVQERRKPQWEATFAIHIKYRQNASWQGGVTWVDKQKKEYFRSALELARLIDSVMGKAENK